MPAQIEPVATRVRPYGEAAIAEAAALILAGQPVATPTETVYGLAADATSGEAVARIYAAKGRPAFNPLIVHVADMEMARSIAAFSPAAEALADRFWPGPLTLVLPRTPGCPVASLATAGLETIAIRMPAHPAIQALIRASGRTLAAPSANASGTISPTRADHVLRSLAGRIPFVIDAGETRHGLESTIVAITADRLRLLRPGPVTADALEQASGLVVETAASDAIEAPGQLASHYAPSLPLRPNVAEARPGEWLIGFGSISGDATLSTTGDLVEAAARLFARLHEADASGRAAIAIAPIPESGLGIAINDRIRRAAAPR